MKPGGFLYLIDGHPLYMAMDDSPGTEAITLLYAYLSSGRPTDYPETDGSYASPEAKLVHRRTAEFPHGLGEIVTSLVEAGLQIEFLREWPFSTYRSLLRLQKSDDGYYRLPPGEPSIPFLFSIKAKKL